MSKGKLVLAFSGGLDTSYCLVSLREQGWEVLTVTVNTGGVRDDEADEIRMRAEELGTSKHVVIDARSKLYDRYISYAIKGNYLRNGAYPSCVGMERRVQAECVAELAVREEADAIAHGSTGAGGDHVRFDVAIRTIAPGLEIITPIRDEQHTREKESEYLSARGFPTSEKTTKYSINEGLIGTTIGGGETYGSWDYLPEDAWTVTRSVQDAPDEPLDLVIHFDRGVPVACETADGQPLPGTGPDAPNYSILATLNQTAAEHGVGRGIHTGHTMVGNTARLGFEAPGMLTLIAAHRELERLVLTSRQQNTKASLGTTYGDMLHEAIYYDPLMSDIEAFLDSSQERVTGQVRVRLHKGNIVLLGCSSPHSLLDAGRRRGAIYGYGSSMWTGTEARAFAKLYSVSGAIARTAAETSDENHAVSG